MVLSDLMSLLQNNENCFVRCFDGKNYINVCNFFYHYDTFYISSFSVVSKLTESSFPKWTCKDFLDEIKTYFTLLRHKIDDDINVCLYLNTNYDESPIEFDLNNDFLTFRWQKE